VFSSGANRKHKYKYDRDRAAALAKLAECEEDPKLAEKVKATLQISGRKNVPPSSTRKQDTLGGVADWR
jgi:hypothetical protein